MLAAQVDFLKEEMQKAADMIRKADYTPARSTLLVAIDTVNKEQKDMLENPILLSEEEINELSLGILNTIRGFGKAADPVSANT